MMRMGIPTVTVTASMFPPSTAGLLDSRVYGVSPIELPSAAPRESCATTPRFEEALRHDGGRHDQRRNRAFKRFVDRSRRRWGTSSRRN